MISGVPRFQMHWLELDSDCEGPTGVWVKNPDTCLPGGQRRPRRKPGDLAGNGGRARAAGPCGDPGRRGPVGAGPGDSVTAGSTGPDTDLGTEERALAPGRCLTVAPYHSFIGNMNLQK